MQNYDALKFLWPDLPGKNIGEKLTALNIKTVPAIKPEPVLIDPDTTNWFLANGWLGPLNQNDLVAAGIITDDERKDFEKGMV